MARARKVALVCMTPGVDGASPETRMPSYGVRRIHAALLSDPSLPELEVRMFDHSSTDEDYFVSAIEEFDPDIVGFSLYIWSQLLFVNVARRIKQTKPSRLVIFGGPSARTQLLDLPPYQNAADYVDGVVTREGEVIFRRIVGLEPLVPSGLLDIGGIEVPRGAGWLSTGVAPIIARLDDLPSPFQLGLMHSNEIGYLETFRGCPMSCVFCEWGVADRANLVFSEEYLTRELQAMRDTGVSAVFSVDAGINLNARAFRNLVAAERRVGFLRHLSAFSVELYPSYLNELQLEFLREMSLTYVGIGVQSFESDVLDAMSRPFKHQNLVAALDKLHSFVAVDAQLIFGLPTDTPAQFRRSLDRAMKLPCSSLRVCHCLVLPDALMSRGKPEWNMKFDPVSLAMTSCLGWSERDILETRAYMDTFAAEHGGFHGGTYWWTIPVTQRDREWTPRPQGGTVQAG